MAKKRIDFRQKQTAEPGDGSASNLGAQSTKLLQARDSSTWNIIVKVKELLKDRKLSTSDKLVIELQMLYGLRISSVLNVVGSDVLPNGGIYVKESKGSSNRIVYSMLFNDYVLMKRLSPLCRLNDKSRFYFYRLYKKYGIYDSFNGGVNNSVTHFFRHYLAQVAEDGGVDVADIGGFLGHKNKKSTGYYAGKKKRDS